MEIVVVLVVAVAVAVLGVRVGMLVAPRIDRWATPPELDADRPDTDRPGAADAEAANPSTQHPDDRNENASVDDSR